jgi:hypothetical protein
MWRGRASLFWYVLNLKDFAVCGADERLLRHAKWEYKVAREEEREHAQGKK